MATGQNPFQNARDIKSLFETIKNADFPIPSKLSSNIVDLIKKLLIADPEKRLGSSSIKDVKDHSFFKNVNWVEVMNTEKKGMLTPRFNKEEVMLSALHVNIFDRGESSKAINLKGFTFNEEFEK